MATKLTGMVNLTKIPKSLIVKNKNGESCIWVSIVPNKDGEDKYGNTHSVQMYDKEIKAKIYLGNLKTEEFGKPQGQPRNASQEANMSEARENPADDLPF